MRIKQLTLQGFKTFAKRTELFIDGDITAVIGPNGSGKSNVADAIRWVLGEQSIATLRARKTEDLIFSGSAQKSQQGMAEVTMVFDNTDHSLPLDYSEVSITRRAFRSGESEYFINKSRVRLRDIQELISSVGQSFMVVGQGLSDEILSLKPEERRTLFEEAAGIRPFYAQRDEALRRLGRTERRRTDLARCPAPTGPRRRDRAAGPAGRRRRRRPHHPTRKADGGRGDPPAAGPRGARRRGTRRRRAGAGGGRDPVRRQPRRPG